MTSYGTVTIGTKTFIEREQSFPFQQAMTVNNQVVTPVLQLPGVADFWLKTLTRVTVIGGVATAALFKFRLGNTDGSVWYQNGGIGGTTDRILDPLLFGTGQFPFVLNPFIYYVASGGIRMEIEDATGAATGSPYTIFFNFRGSYLIPANSGQ